jgi:hypothetical protein
LDDLNLAEEDRKLILDAYMHGLRVAFTVFVWSIAAFFVLSLCIKDYGLVGKDKPRVESEALQESYTDE